MSNRPRPGDNRRQLPNQMDDNRVPAQLREDHIAREVDRRRQRDFRDRTPSDRDDGEHFYPQGQDQNRRSLDNSLDNNSNRSNPKEDQPHEKKNYVKSKPRSESNDYDDRDRDRGRYDDRDRDRGYDDRDRDRGYDDRDRGRYDDRDRDRGYDDRDRGRYNERSVDGRGRDHQMEERYEADKFIEEKAEPEPKPPTIKIAKPEKHRPPFHRKIALVCSIIQIVLSFLYIGLGVASAVVHYLELAFVPWICAIGCLCLGGVGIHSFRHQGHNFMNAVTTVAVIVSVVYWAAFGIFCYISMRFLNNPGYQFHHRRNESNYISIAGICLTVVALGCASVMLWIACAVTCCAEGERPPIQPRRKKPKAVVDNSV